MRWLFPIVHATHHHYDRPRPLNLFVLNPAEVLGFGGLWLALLCVYPATWAGILIYLTLNLAFGTLGHLGVEPFPKAVARWPLLRHLGSSTFHANHHGDRDVNFGFYTDVWDPAVPHGKGTGPLNGRADPDLGHTMPACRRSGCSKTSSRPTCRRWRPIRPRPCSWSKVTGRSGSGRTTRSG